MLMTRIRIPACWLVQIIKNYCIAIAWTNSWNHRTWLIHARAYNGEKWNDKCRYFFHLSVVVIIVIEREYFLLYENDGSYWVLISSRVFFFNILFFFCSIHFFIQKTEKLSVKMKNPWVWWWWLVVMMCSMLLSFLHEILSLKGKLLGKNVL